MSKLQQTQVCAHGEFDLSQCHFQTTRLFGLMNSDFTRGNIDDFKEVNPHREVLQQEWPLVLRDHRHLRCGFSGCAVSHSPGQRSVSTALVTTEHSACTKGLLPGEDFNGVAALDTLPLYPPRLIRQPLTVLCSFLLSSGL